MMFGPPYYGVLPYGAEAASQAAAPTTDSSFTSLFQQFAPTALQALVGKDAREESALVQAQIANYKRMRVTPPYSIVPGTLFYDNEIAKLKARLEVLKTKAGEETTAAQATADWRSLGQTGLAVGVVAGVAVVGLLLAVTVKTLRKNPRRGRRR